MTSKEYLSQALYLDKRLKAKERRLDWLRSHAEYVSPQISESPKTASGIKSPLEEAVVRIVDLETEIALNITELVRLKQEIANAIRGVNSIECETILEMRYLALMTWEDIAMQMNYSNDYIYHLHRKALSLVKIN